MIYDINTRYSWHQISSQWHHIHSLGHHTTLCMTLSPLYLTSRALYLCHHTTLSMTSQTLHGRNYIQYICDIIFPMFLTKYPLSKTSQPSVLMSPHSAYVWHSLHSRWHRINSITPNNSIYDVTSTSGMTSHPLYQTLHQLYLCHHNIYTDITPSFKWHHTLLLCDIICTI